MTPVERRLWQESGLPWAQWFIQTYPEEIGAARRRRDHAVWVARVSRKQRFWYWWVLRGRKIR